MDIIRITDLEAIGYIGVKDDERANPQNLLISFHGVYDLSKAMQTDNVSDTINYSTIAKRIKAIVAETKYRLLEALANHIMRELFYEFSFSEITLRIEKPHRVANTRLVGIEITRKAENYS
ncbi:MAG TPA: dihydroneopterin aldolase [Anaerolineaceae bacterium]|nr:dihydroneopterin aldolase [Anaerolineaceae bacterium]